MILQRMSHSLVHIVQTLDLSSLPTRLDLSKEAVELLPLPLVELPYCMYEIFGGNAADPIIASKAYLRCTPCHYCIGAVTPREILSGKDSIQRGSVRGHFNDLLTLVQPSAYFYWCGWRNS